MRPWHRFVSPILKHFRRKRGELILKLFPELPQFTVLDLGGSVHFWRETGLIDFVRQVKIYNITENELVISGSVDSRISIHIYDGMKIPEADQSFDLVLSNSVLEHVPPATRRQVAVESRRLGRHGFIQTPAFEFPIEPHFVMPIVHWLPRNIGRKLIRWSPWTLLSKHPDAVQTAYWNEVQLLRRRDLADLYPGTVVSAERFVGLPKSWTVTW